MTACVTMTPRAQDIRLVSSETLTANCQRLGAVSGQAAAWGQINADAVDQQAKNNMKDSAAAKYGAAANAVLLTSVDREITKSSAVGVAYQCP
jgi:hypothetical protein